MIFLLLKLGFSGDSLLLCLHQFGAFSLDYLLLMILVVFRLLSWKLFDVLTYTKLTITFFFVL